MVGESAAQSSFSATILVLVGSDTPEGAQSGIDSILTSTSVFTNEYCNELDNNQFLEGAFGWLVRPYSYLAFRWCKLAGFLRRCHPYSIDELTTLYHFPDVNYNKSPIIYWLGYKKYHPQPTSKHQRKSHHDRLCTWWGFYHHRRWHTTQDW